MKYKLCELCGAALDFGERCDCIDENKKEGAEQCQQSRGAKQEPAAYKILALSLERAQLQQTAAR